MEGGREGGDLGTVHCRSLPMVQRDIQSRMKEAGTVMSWAGGTQSGVGPSLWDLVGPLAYVPDVTVHTPV